MTPQQFHTIPIHLVPFCQLTILIIVEYFNRILNRFLAGFPDFRVDTYLDFTVDYGFQFGFLPTMYEISFVMDPSVLRWVVVSETMTQQPVEDTIKTFHAWMKQGNV